jgi:DNA-binding SARP family transcriptional activator/Tfp pilus assembly protein PilF
MICIYLLGAPRIEIDGDTVQVDTRKAIALLAYLAMSGESHSRDTIAALLWSDYDSTHARGALRRTLSALNKALQGRALHIGRELIGLEISRDVWVDVIEFNRLLASCSTHGHSSHQICPLCLEPLQGAVALYRDDFLAGFSLRDSAAFDDWQFFHSDALRRDLSGALEMLVQGCAAQAEFATAISYAQRWLSLDSLHEPAHRQLMQLYALSGQRNAALRQYHECVRILEKELGVPPLEETTQIYNQIKEKPGAWQETSGNKSSPLITGWDSRSPIPSPAWLVEAKSQAKAAPAPTLASLPLIGREGEWSSLQRAYASIKKDGYLVVLEGEAGIGKTRLAEDFLAVARSLGAGVIQARCFEGEENLAYAPLVDGLGKAIEQAARPDWHASIPLPWLSEAARLLPILYKVRSDLSPPPSPESTGAQTRFYAGLSQVVWALCAQHPAGVLFIDDIQWADEASMDLLTYLVRRLQGQPILILITWRGEDLDPGHRLRRLLADAQRNGQAELLNLSRLNPQSIESLVQSTSTRLGNSLSTLSHRLFLETEGLPFFVVEYLAALPSETEIIAHTGLPMPHSVRDLLRSRLEQIGETGWQLLQAAAVIGRSFDFDTLRQTSGRTEDETITTLEALTRRGILREFQPSPDDTSVENGRPPSYDFSHEKLRELVYSETSLARQRLLHLRLAEALVSLWRGQREQIALAGQIAYHYKQGGRAREAAEYYLRAGAQARAVYANHEALAHFQAALALGHPDIASVNEAIGDMHMLIGNYGAAIQSLETALAQLNQRQDTARLGHKLGEIYHRLGEWNRAESYFQACIEVLASEGDVAAQAGIYADWSRTLYQSGEMERAAQMAQQALSLAETAGDTLALAQAHNILGILARNRNELADAAWHLEQSLTLAKNLPEPGARIAALNNLSLVYADQGDLEQAIAYADQALNLCASLGDRHREAALHNNLADLFHLTGRKDDSMAHLKQAVSIFSDVEDLDLPGNEPGNRIDRVHPEIWKLTEW